MKADFYLKQGDTWPSLQAKLVDGNNDLVPIQNAEQIKFTMTKYKDRKSVVIENGDIVLDYIDGVYWATYLWNSDDTENAGWYQGEFIITFNGGKQVTVPNDSDNYINILIGKKLG